MKNTTIKPKGKFFNPPPEPQEEEYAKTFHDDSLTRNMKSVDGKLEKKIIKKYFSPPDKGSKK